MTIHACAAALFSDKAHRWDGGETLGVDRLRQKIFRALNAYERRLCALERQTLTVFDASPPPAEELLAQQGRRLGL